MRRLRVTHTATGRTVEGTPDELESVLGWWIEDPEERVGRVRPLVQDWQDGHLDTWRHVAHGLTVEDLGA